MTVCKRDITTDIQPNEEVKEIVDSFEKQLSDKMSTVMTKSLCQIDTKSSYVRSHESSIGDFFADVMKTELNADCALMNAGSIRSDRFYEAGYLSAGDWVDMFPYRTKLFKVKVTGDLLKKILEQGVAKYPSFEGRFPSISNIEFEFDASLPPYERINPESLKVGGKSVKGAYTYTMVAPSFIVQGLDGYDHFKESKKMMVESEAPVFIDTLFQIFRFTLNETFVKEFKFFKAYESESIDTFLTSNVRDKVAAQQTVLDFVQEVGYEAKHFKGHVIEREKIYDNQHLSDLDMLPEILPTLSKKSSVILDQRGRIIENSSLDILTEDNYASVLSGKCRLSIGCLVR